MVNYPLINAPEVNDVSQAIFILCVLQEHRVNEYIPNTQIIYVPHNYEEYLDLLKKLPFPPSSKVICYDLTDNEFAARIWWGFQTVGFQDVWILNGGLKAWKAENKTVEKGLPQVVVYNSEPANLILNRKVDRTISLTQNTYLSDSILRANNTFNQLLGPDMKLQPKNEIIAFFQERQLNLKKQVRVHCMGDKAGIGLAALAYVGFKDLTYLFDSNAVAPEALSTDAVPNRHSLHSNYYSFTETLFQDTPTNEAGLEERRSMPSEYYGAGLSEKSSPKAHITRRTRQGNQSASSCSSCLII